MRRQKVINHLLGRKIGITQIFSDDGKIVPVTVVECGPCVVTQIKKPETDGYTALQLGFAGKKAKRVNQAEAGHAKKANTAPKRFVREIPWDGKDEVKLGQALTVDIFKDIKYVDVVGTMKGKGFAGVVKRHHFTGGPKTHGQSDRHRAPGSIGGSAWPSRVRKGMRMGGHMGACRRTVRDMELVQVNTEKNLLLIRGGVPGPNGGFVIVRQTNKMG
jgi:large subunit ribosomal protein L3